MRICLNGCSGILTVDKCRFRTEKYGSQWMGNAPKPGFTHDYCSCGGNFLWITGCRKTTGNVIHMTLPAGLYYSQNKKINFGTFHNGLIGGVNCNVERQAVEENSKKELTFCAYGVNISFVQCICGSVGTGRRARLRILWQQCRVGSSPIFRM